MSRKTYYRIASVAHAAGSVMAFLGIFILMFVVCCADSEGEEIIRLLIRLTASGALMAAAGALLIKVSKIMIDGRNRYARTQRPSYR